MTEAAVAERKISLTENAAERIRVLMEMEGRDDLMLRLTISGGGCSGFQYGIALDEVKNDEDTVYEQHGVKVVIDETSLELLDGAVIDFVEDLVGSSFQIRNPNASSTCGCGSSFSV